MLSVLHRIVTDLGPNVSAGVAASVLDALGLAPADADALADGLADADGLGDAEPDGGGPTTADAVIGVSTGAALWSRSPAAEQYVVAVVLANATCRTVSDTVPAVVAVQVPVALIGPSGTAASLAAAGYAVWVSVTVPDCAPPTATVTRIGTSPALSGTGPLVTPAAAVRVTVTVCPAAGLAGLWLSVNESAHAVGDVPVPASLKYSRQPRVAETGSAASAGAARPARATAARTAAPVATRRTVLTSPPRCGRGGAGPAARPAARPRR